MPIYPCKCECGHYDEVYRPVDRYKDLPQHCGKKMKRYFTPTNIMPDLTPYRSMEDGSMITSRKHHREHLKKHGLIEIGNEKLKPPKRKTYDQLQLGDLRGEIRHALDSASR